MIDIMRAAAAGEAFVRDLYAGETLAGLRVEEVERLGDGPSWTVTVGWLDPVNAKSLIPVERRIYRTLQVDATTGAVTSMRMRGAAA